jgi:DNA mismatch repair protein MutS2
MQTVFEILDWPRLLEHLESCCQTGYGRLLVSQETLFFRDAKAIQHEMTRVDETKRLIQRFGDVTLQETPDILPTLERLEKGGDIQSPQELAILRKGLTQLRLLARFFIQNRSKDLTPSLLVEIESMTLPNAVIERLENTVSEEEELLDSVSEAYTHLKQKRGEIQRGIHQTLQRMMNNPTISKYLQELIVTERQGRSVLPVKAEHKVDLPGIVHGTSASGVTLYIEPKSVIEQNNRFISVTAELEREIRRLLKAVSEALRPEASALQQFLTQAAQLDLAMGKARQSLILKANPVEVWEQPGRLYLRQARHPLLILQGINVIANDILLEVPNQALLITGPNTGGKTVILKLIGLLALMARAGLHLPVSEDSSLSFFDPILADIGDPQSIAQSLSTFSGHMSHLNAFLSCETLSQGLILIDEICAGTDPQEGSALAQALLETFYERGATTVVTTHIGELKVFAHQHPGFLNASVEFDTESLSPTYRLILGVPGSSNALNIASRLGIPDEVIATARSRMSQATADSAQLIESLEMKNRKIAEELAAAQKLREEIQWEETQIRKQLDRIEGEKRKTLQLYREGLRDKLRVIEREVDALKEEVKTPQKKDRQALQRLSGQFRRAQGQTGELFHEESQKLYPNTGLDWNSIQKGDIVECRSLNLNATVVEKNHDRQEVTLQAGILKTVVPFSEIIKKIGKEQSKAKGNQRQSHGKIHLQPKTIALECDVRGMNSEDALAILDKFLDDAMVSGVSTVAVIHGLGSGILKKAVRNHLKALPYIKSFSPAPAMEGGDGKTIIMFS